MAQRDGSTKRAYVSCWNSCVPHDLIAITASFLWCFRVMVFIYSEISWESELHTEELNPFMHCSVSVNKARWQKSQLLIGIVWLLQKGPCSHSFQRSTEVHGWCKCSECTRAFFACLSSEPNQLSLLYPRRWCITVTCKYWHWWNCW